MSPFGRCVARGRENRLLGQEGDDAGSAFDAIAHLYIHPGPCIEQHVGSRTELDQPHSLAANQPISNFGVEDDTPREKPRDLLEDHGLPVTFDSHDVLLIQVCAIWTARIEKLSALVSDVSHYAADWRPVHVHVDDAEENAYSEPLLLTHHHGRNVRNLAVCGRNQRVGALRNGPFRITKEPEEEARQKDGKNRPRGVGQPTKQYADRDQGQPVIVTITNPGG